MLVGIFLSGDIPFFSKELIPFYSLMLLVMVFSLFFTFRQDVLSRLRRLNKDIEEILSGIIVK